MTILVSQHDWIIIITNTVNIHFHTTLFPAYIFSAKALTSRIMLSLFRQEHFDSSCYLYTMRQRMTDNSDNDMVCRNQLNWTLNGLHYQLSHDLSPNPMNSGLNYLSQLTHHNPLHTNCSCSVVDLLEELDFVSLPPVFLLLLVGQFIPCYFHLRNTFV